MYFYDHLETDSDSEGRGQITENIEFTYLETAVYLTADEHRFLGIYTESDAPSDRGVIVLHGTGFHPNWEQVVQPVRVGLTDHGWNTLSIQLPLLQRDAAYEDYVPLYPEVPARMEAAHAFLANKGVNTVVVIAHSQGATMASYYLARHPHDIEALVAIGMSAQHVQQTINSAESLKLIEVPVLDIYGSKDFPAVLATAELRRAGAAHNKKYRQQVIDNAYHFFDDHNQELIEALLEWLGEYF